MGFLTSFRRRDRDLGRRDHDLGRRDRGRRDHDRPGSSPEHLENLNMPQTAATPLTRQEATLRSIATACLAGIAVVQAIRLPFMQSQAEQLAVLSMAAMAMCLALGLALAAAPAGAGRQVWRLVAAAGALVIAAYAIPHVALVPGTGEDRGHWTAAPGLISAALAAASLACAIYAARPTRAPPRGVAAALAVVVALAPGVAGLLVALGPGPLGGEQALAAGGHVHSHASGESAIIFRPGSGRAGGHFVVAVPPPPHQTPMGVALAVGAAGIFVYGAVAYLRRRTAPGARVAVAVMEGGAA